MHTVKIGHLVRIWTVGMLALMAVMVSSAAPDAGFVLRDYLGHAWTNECVTFPLMRRPEHVSQRIDAMECNMWRRIQRGDCGNEWSS